MFKGSLRPFRMEMDWGIFVSSGGAIILATQNVCVVGIPSLRALDIQMELREY